MIIPGFGIVSHVVATFSGKPVFGLFSRIYMFLMLGVGFINLPFSLDQQVFIDYGFGFTFIYASTTVLNM